MIDTNFIDAVTSEAFRFVVLVELSVTGNAPIRMTTDAINTKYEGKVFVPGIIDNISSAKSSDDISDTGISVKLSGIDDALLSVVSGDNFVNSQCKVYLLAQEFLDSHVDGFYTAPTIDTTLVTMDSTLITLDAQNIYYKNEGGFLLFDGVVAAPPSLAFGGETSISIAVQSRMIAKDRNRSERYADADQQKKYPGDLGMQYATEVGNKSVRWPAASWFRNQE